MTRSTTTQYRFNGAVILLCGALLTGMNAGCSGPTKAGKEARAEANERMGLVNAQINYDQALRAYEVGQFDRALKEINVAIERAPQQPQFHLLKGRILIEEHRLEPALNSFNRALEFNENYPEAHYFSGIVYQRWSQHERAFESYMKAAEVDTTNVQYLVASAESLVALERYDEAESLIKPKLAYFEHNSALRHLLGQIAMLQDDPNNAVKLLTEARMLNPDDKLLMEELARAQFAAGMFGRCNETVRQLHRLLGTRRADLVQLEARTLVMMERMGEARSAYIELTKLTPDDVEAWVELGAVAFAIGDPQRLTLCGTRIVALAPERWEGYFLQAMFERTQDSSKSADRHLTLLRQSVSRANDAGSAAALPHLMYGLALEERGEQASALSSYSHAMRLEPDNVDANRLFNRLNGSSRMTAVSTD
jgi:Flp pilus assembly protein TadD